MSITLKQIAELAGTTKSTVDKVIHDRPGVSEKKRQEIRALLEQYGYEANPLAKALNYQKKKMSAAVVLPNVDARPFIKKGIELVLQDLNSFNINVQYYEMSVDEDQEGECLEKILTDAPEISGILLLPLEGPRVRAAMEAFGQRQIPVITLNSELYGAPSLCYVGQDPSQSANTAARMLQLFCPSGAKAAIISSPSMHGHEQRRSSFASYIKENCPQIDLLAVQYIEETPEDAYTKTLMLLHQYPDLNALYITCGRVSDICRAIKDRSETHPDQTRPEAFTIICYEKYPEIIDLVHEGRIACTISSSLSNQGRLAMRLLFEYLVYGKAPEKQRYYTDSEILIKENIR